MNLNKLMNKSKITDSKRIEDMRSGGSGSLRSSIFNRQDEALTKETIALFKKKFAAMKPLTIEGGNLEGTDGKKHVCGCKLKLPDKVSIGGGVDALLAKVDYDKNTRTFKAYYRPKNGKWGQAENVNVDF